MRRKLIAGNWKLNGNRTMALAWRAQVEAGALAGVDLAVMPPATLLATLAGSSAYALGGQDISSHGEGAYTGEISGAMLAEAGASMVLVGHSERREYHQESDALVAAKFKAALAAGLTPVLCLGERLEERDSGTTDAVVSRQLLAVLDTLGVEALGRGLVAYEPVWAIGTGRTASPEQAQQVHALLRGIIASHSGNIAGSLRILYGGSVKPENAGELFRCADVDGALVGGASLSADSILAIARAASSAV